MVGADLCVRPLRRADTQVGPYERSTIGKRPRRPKNGLWCFTVIALVITMCGTASLTRERAKVRNFSFIVNRR